MKRTLTVCPYCGCGCMFYLVSDGGRLVGMISPNDITRVLAGAGARA